jgi:hypothetical protein
VGWLRENGKMVPKMYDWWLTFIKTLTYF